MNKSIIAISLIASLEIILLGTAQGADICQGNICIDSKGTIYVKGSETITSSLLSGTTTSGTNNTSTSGTGLGTTTSNTTGTILTGKILTGTTGTSISTKPNLTGTVITGNISTGTTTISTGIKTNTPLQTSNTITTMPVFTTRTEELNAAILRGYTNDITIHNTVSDYQENNLVTREQAAKLFYQTAIALDYNSTTNTDCIFSDITTVSESLRQNIKNICALGGLMKGDKGLFSPLNNLSYAQTVTVIARIAGITNISSKNARRAPYLGYVKNLGILKNTNISERTMESKITRGDLIILLYRLSLVYDNNGGILPMVDSTTSTQNPSLNSNLPSDKNSSNSLVSIGAGIIDTPKFTTALLWMYHSDMTIFWKASDYDPFSTLTREQAAKFLSIYNTKFNKFNNTSTGTTTTISCNYTDIKDSGLQSYITDACKAGIFKNVANFNPNNAIVKSEFVTAILNMLQEKPNTGQTVANKALELDIISRADLNTFDKPITRYEVALILSNLHLQNKFIINLKDTSVTYNVIAPIEQDTTIYPAGQQKVFIDINSIDSKEFNNGFINLFGKSYKITKKEIINYFPTSYSRYGEIADITNDNEIGSISMAIGPKGGTKMLIEGFIAFPDTKEIYSIYPTAQIPYYMITKIK